MDSSLEVWQEASALARRMQQVTAAVAERIDRGEVDVLPSLLGERQKICEQLDRLRQEYGIASWVAAGESDSNLPEGICAASREIAGIFRSLLDEDERIRRKLEEKMLAVKNDLMQVKRMKEVHRLYAGGSSPICGAFIDSRR